MGDRYIGEKFTLLGSNHFRYNDKYLLYIGGSLFLKDAHKISAEECEVCKTNIKNLILHIISLLTKPL